VRLPVPPLSRRLILKDFLLNCQSLKYYRKSEIVDGK
jgi:hypothetical protein